MLKNILVSVGASIIVVLIGLFVFSPNQSINFAGITHLSGLQVGTDGLSTTGTFSSTGAATFSAQVKNDANQLSSYTLSTTTPASMTLRESDILYSTILVTPTVGAATLTLPASSTLTTIVPTAGDRARLVIVNASTTAGQALTIAGGTGVLLSKATTTATILSGGQGVGIIEFIRKTNTDIVANFINSI